MKTILYLALTVACTAPVNVSCDRISQNREAILHGAAAQARTQSGPRENGPQTASGRRVTADFSGSELPVNPKGLPSQIKNYEGFTVSFNKETGNPNWSAWELRAEETAGAESRKGQKFWQDTSLKGCVTTKDYTNSGYDRGHMCPAADMKWSPKAMNDCFSMANITPQDHSLNSGAWSTLEKKCREWAQRDGTLLIAAGPIYEGTTPTMAGGKVRVPSAFFKVIVAPGVDDPRGIAFVYPNAAAPGNMARYAMSIDEVERMTGYDFFASLPDDVENKVESSFSFKEWMK